MIASWISRVRFDVMTTTGGDLATIAPQFGNRHLEVGQHLEQVGFERFVGAVEFVDQQHRRDAIVRVDRLQQRPLEQELRREDVLGQIVARDRRPPPPASRISIICRG